MEHLDFLIDLTADSWPAAVPQALKAVRAALDKPED